MEGEDIVESSDVDEQEILHATSTEYWNQAISAIENRRALLDGLLQAPGVLLISPSELNAGPKVYTRRDSTPPRKRLKTDNQESLSLTDKPCMYKDWDSEVLIRNFPSSGSSRSTSLIRTPHVNSRPDVETPDAVLLETPKNSQDTLALTLSEEGDIAHVISKLRYYDYSESPSGPLKSSDVMMHSRYEIKNDPQISKDTIEPSPIQSLSPDPLRLFTPPKMRTAKLMQQPDVQPIMHEPEGTNSSSPIGLPPSTPTVLRLYSPSSPLTPLPLPNNLFSSPHSLSRYLSPASLVPHFHPSPLFSASSSSPEPLTTNHPVTTLDEQPNQAMQDKFGRYSLRTRQAKQLNPYAYDQAYYKKQMRENPDAVVKVVSPEHEKRQHRRHEDDLAFDREPYHYAERATGTGSRDGSPVVRAPKRKTSASMSLTKLRHTTPLQAKSDREQSRVKWYPKVFEESSGSDDEGGEEANRISHREINDLWKQDKARRSNRNDDGGPSSMLSRGASPQRLQYRDNLNEEYLARDYPHEDHELRRSPSFMRIHDDDNDCTSQDAINDEVEIGSPVSAPRPSPTPNMWSSSTEVSDEELSGSSLSEDLSSKERKERKRLKILRRMMPEFMISRVLEKGQRPSGARSMHLDEEERDGSPIPVLPGHSKVRIVDRPHKITADIIGDSESSEPESVLMSSRDNSDLEIENSSSQGHKPDNDDEGLDEANINAWLIQSNESRKSYHRPRENLIDWMLSKTRHVGVQGRRKAAGHGRKPERRSTPSLNIVTGGARKYGNGRQTLLNFHNDSATKQDVRGRHQNTDGSGLQNIRHRPDSVQEVRPEYVSEATRKKKRRRRQLARNSKGYTLSGQGGRIVSGRRQVHAMTIDFEDDDFHQALAPFNDQDRQTRKSESSIRRIVRKTSPVRIDIHEDEGTWSDRLGASPRRANVGPDLVFRDIKSDCNVPLLPSGVAFGASTYLGRGWLHELIMILSGSGRASRPIAFAAYGLELGPTSSISDLCTCFPTLCDHLFKYVTDPTEDCNADELKKWENTMHITCQLVSWLTSNADSQEDVATLGSLEQETNRLTQRLEDALPLCSDLSTDFRSWTVGWFCVEISARLSRLSRNNESRWDIQPFMTHCTFLVCRLRQHGIQRSVESVSSLDEVLDEASVPVRAAEIWVCLIHLADVVGPLAANHGNTLESHLFWSIVAQTFQAEERMLQSDLENSEDIWKTLFSLNALSQFSLHGMVTSTPRLPAAWKLVEYALKRIRLTAEIDPTQALSKRSLFKRDGYIRLVVSRCFILWKKWRWRLDGASAMFNYLVEIFKSRKFCNLLDERSDFPNFLRRNDLRLLSECGNGDTAFTIFLKLIVQTVNDLRMGRGMGADDTSIPRLKKLLSLAVPVGSVPFTKSTPPMGQDLSMLYNRYSSIAVAIYLDPTPANVRYRLAQAQRYVTFKDTDFTTRMACVRGVMHFAILIRHFKLPLDVVLNWLAEMTNVLVDECRDIDVAVTSGGGDHPSDAKNRILLTIQLLLGSVRRIIETPSMDPSEHLLEYPDPSLLEGPWVARVFSATTNLANVATTGIEIRRLVQAFLDARAAIVPRPRVNRPVPFAPSVGNQDSQDEYGHLDLDLDDPELLAALGEDNESSSSKEIKMKDESVCQVIDQHISPAIYRLVCKHINDPSRSLPTEDYWSDVDKWIDCWVGCANVIVRNGRRDWSHYLTLGPQSWERIIETSWRRKVGLRFMYMVLLSDPSAYPTYKDRFLDVLFESTVTAKVTFEHSYVSLLFSIDGLHHSLLRGISWDMAGNGEISKAGFLAKRLSILEGIFSNLSSSLQNERDFEVRAQNQTNVGFVVTMFSTMQDIFQQIDDRSEDFAIYKDFCRAVFAVVRKYPALQSQPRLISLMKWGEIICSRT